MKIKKLIVAILCLSMIVASFSACSNSKDSALSVKTRRSKKKKQKAQATLSRQQKQLKQQLLMKTFLTLQEKMVTQAVTKRSKQLSIQNLR